MSVAKQDLPFRAAARKVHEPREVVTFHNSANFPSWRTTPNPYRIPQRGHESTPYTMEAYSDWGASSQYKASGGNFYDRNYDEALTDSAQGERQELSKVAHTWKVILQCKIQHLVILV